MQVLDTHPLAPSDEGAVNGVDWGREPGFSISAAQIKSCSFSLPPSKIFDFCHLPHQREAWVSAFLYAGGTLVRGSASRNARYKTGNSQRQAKSCSFPRREKGKRKVFLAVEEEMCYNKKSNVDMLCPLMRKYRKKAFERFFKRECEVGFPKCMENGIFRQS